MLRVPNEILKIIIPEVLILNLYLQIFKLTLRSVASSRSPWDLSFKYILSTFKASTTSLAHLTL